jgi:hypothetical protein
MLGSPVLTEDQLRKIAYFVLRPECAKFAKLANPGFRIYEGMRVTYMLLPGFPYSYRFTFEESHIDISQFLAHADPKRYQLEFSTNELIEILNEAERVQSQSQTNYSLSFTTTQRARFTLPTDLERCKTLTAQLMRSPSLGIFAPLFSALKIYSSSNILFSPIENCNHFKVRPSSSHMPLLTDYEHSAIKQGTVTIFADRPGKFYLVYAKQEEFDAALNMLKRYFYENTDFRVAQKKWTVEILGRLFDLFPDISLAVVLSTNQIMSLGQAYALNLHLCTMIQDSRNIYLNFSQITADKFDTICENIKEALGTEAFSFTTSDKVILIHAPLQQILSSSLAHLENTKTNRLRL